MAGLAFDIGCKLYNRASLCESIGPPGNGKTESIKALLHDTPHSILYVKTISTPWVSTTSRVAFFTLISLIFTCIKGPEYGVRMVFEQARKHSPCILVLEDLDSMVTNKVKSFFLNELDGLVRTSHLFHSNLSKHRPRLKMTVFSQSRAQTTPKISTMRSSTDLPGSTPSTHTTFPLQNFAKRSLSSGSKRLRSLVYRLE